MADAGGHTIVVSPNTAQVTGFTAEELTAGGLDGWLAQIHPDDVAAVRERYQALKSKWAPHDMDYRLRHRDGHWMWIHDFAMSAYEVDGVVYFAGVLIDITTRKQAELEVQQQRQLLMHLTRVATLGELSGALAHELSQPLTSILTNAQAALHFLADEPANLAEVRDILNDIVDADRRAGEFIRRLRALLRGGETPRQPLDVNEVTSDVLRLLHSELVARAAQGERRPGRSAAGAPEPDRQRVRRDAARRAAGAPDRHQHLARRRRRRAGRDRRPRRRLAGREHRARVRAVLHHEGAGPRPGSGHLPIDRDGPWRAPLGHEQSGPGGDVLVHAARLERGGAGGRLRPPRPQEPFPHA